MSTLCALLFVLNSCVCSHGNIGSRQAVAVTGELTCDDEPAARVKVKLYHKLLPLDIKLAQGVTNENGVFSLMGSTYVLTVLSPKVNVYHKCNYTGYCYRKFSVSIPETFISYGKTSEKPFDLGTIPLGAKFKGESVDCIN
ncbi:unnamed protein product [Angiostrongylus costaricensis]|uniref:Transthyretin-like family protein n=1 Tax=Angiostrongylus costaricensis TaxID=334426 RepID=A0A0R3PKL7_ANGCS|nr:unnamed protein product [Angiostrongylus costaricensis]